MKEITMKKRERKMREHRDKIIKMLNQGPKSTTQFLKEGITQYKMRILELRQLGFNVVYDPAIKRFSLD